VQGRVEHHGYFEGLAVVVRAATEDDDDKGPALTQLLVTGRAIPATLTLERDGRQYHGQRQDRLWPPGKDNGIRINIAEQYVICAKKPDWSWPGSLFQEDFVMRAEGWDDPTQVYDIRLIHLAATQTAWGDPHLCLVVWRYGRGIPGSGERRETKDGYPVYQRIGIIAVSDHSEQYPEDHEPVIDWALADETTIALE
jgi:hypothetical protein